MVETPSAKTPSVDLIIPARNEHVYLGQCLKALFQQNYERSLLNVYVVDNGSTDNTAAIARQFGAHVLSKPGVSLGALRNLALAVSSGQLVGFIDAHCIPSNHWLANLVKAFDSPNVGGCAGGIEFVCSDKATANLVKSSMFQSCQTLFRRTISGREAPYPWIPTGNAMFRREALSSVGNFEESLVSCEDVDLSWKIVLAGYRLEFVPEAQVVHHERATGWELVGKHFRYGRGAAQLAWRYGFMKRRSLSSRNTGSSSPAGMLLQLAHAAGYFRQTLSGRNRSLNKIGDMQALPQLRSRFAWAEGVDLQIADDAVYWFDSSDSVIMVLPRQQRRLTGEHVETRIMRSLEYRQSRATTVDLLCSTYDVSKTQAATDLDAFITEMSEIGILKRWATR